MLGFKILLLCFCRDGAHTDSEGFYQITGRIDDVINTSGHRIGTAELEDVLVSNDSKFNNLIET